MRGLFFKVFLGFWIAQSLTFAITTFLIMQRHGVRPNETYEVLNASFPSIGKEAVKAYQTGGCAGLKQYGDSLYQSLYLADTASHYLCDTPPAMVSQRDMERPGVASTMGGDYNLWSTTVSSETGQPYLFVLSRPADRNNHWVHALFFFAFPQLWVAIIVCGATTFVMVLLLIRPIGKLRAAARRLANGELATRVPKPNGEARLLAGDEIQGLVDDFNHMAEQLEHLVGAQQLLLRDVSHELRSPLARLSVALELAREEAPGNMMGHLDRIERETARLNELIAQLLRLSSMESTEATAARETFALSTLMESMLPDVEFEAQRRLCQVRVVRQCNCRVQGSPELIYRAIENVVRNAVRYTREESTVELSMHCEESAGAHTVVLDVSDSGPGLPENELENIFRPFYRVDDARGRDTGGFGVGLAIADRAVRLHHGELRAWNRPEGGLTVSLRLPCNP
jgi:two-component system sensor histidine kinase CpxA